MFRRSTLAISSIALSFTLASCASKPPSLQKIASSANPTTEIERTEELLNDARSRQVDVLSPDNFADAKRYLEKAKSQKEAGKDNEKILENVSYSRGWINEANIKAEIAETQMKEITESRAAAMRAGTPATFPKEWSEADRSLENVTREIEKGNLKPAAYSGKDLSNRYRELERNSVARAHLGAAYDNLEIAKKDGADKKAPKSYERAELKYINAEKLINADPTNSALIARAAADATKESTRLLDIMSRVNAGNTEDLVLQSYNQQRTISNLRNEFTSTEEELQMTQTAADIQRVALEEKQKELERQQKISQKAAAIRSQFKPAEAEVFTENNKLMVRLKGLQFPTNQSTLGPKNQALLKKVEAALGTVEASKITVEGHTDSTGNAEKNRALSEERAKSVANYLSKAGTISEDQIDSVGMSFDNPISDNSTAQGRAQNRRIDLVIETK